SPTGLRRNGDCALQSRRGASGTGTRRDVVRTWRCQHIGTAHFVFPRSLIGAGVPWQGHLKAYYHLCKAVEYIKGHDFDIVHTHLSSSADMYLFPLTAHL